MDKAMQSSEGNGSSERRPRVAAATAKTAIPPRDARQLRFAQSFAHIVAVLMRDPNFRKMRLADLEWLVLPPVMAGQFKLAQMPSPLAQVKGKEGGVLVPVAVALWARVSAAIDKELSENLDKPMRLGARRLGVGRQRVAGSRGRRAARGAEIHRAARQYRVQGTAREDATQGPRQQGGRKDAWPLGLARISRNSRSV